MFGLLSYVPIKSWRVALLRWYLVERSEAGVGMMVWLSGALFGAGVALITALLIAD